MLSPWLAGCAPAFSGLAAGGAKRAVIPDVPFVKQAANQCGPASLAMVMNYWGEAVSQADIAKDVYSPELKGTLSLDIVGAAGQRGFEARMYNGGLLDLREKIAEGFPLIVSYREKRGKTRVHYMVVFGFDDRRREVYAHSDQRENLALGYGQFLRHWNWADNLTFLVARSMESRRP